MIDKSYELGIAFLTSASKGLNAVLPVDDDLSKAVLCVRLRDRTIEVSCSHFKQLCFGVLKGKLMGG